MAASRPVRELALGVLLRVARGAHAAPLLDARGRDLRRARPRLSARARQEDSSRRVPARPRPLAAPEAAAGIARPGGPRGASPRGRPASSHGSRPAACRGRRDRRRSAGLRAEGRGPRERDPPPRCRAGDEAGRRRLPGGANPSSASRSRRRIRNGSWRDGSRRSARIRRAPRSRPTKTTRRSTSLRIPARDPEEILRRSRRTA